MLDGLRVLDLTAITAGGRTTQILADYGADVIKIEGPTRPDPFRHWTNVTGEAGAGDLDSPPFRVVGRNKRGITVNLKDPRGVEVMRRLVAQSDIVVENFRRGVLERLGIGFDSLTQWQPAIVLLSISSQGDSGPERDYVSFGGTLEALGGLMSVTGYGPDQPQWTTSKVNYPDQVVALLAPGLAIWAVLQSRATGQPLHLDLSQRELMMSMLGDLIAEASVTGETPRGHGNADPHDVTVCCPCAGADEWIVVTLRSQDEWTRLVQATALDEIAADQRFASHAARQRHREELAEYMGRWTRGVDKTEAMRTLQRVGIPAAAVLRAHELPAEEPYRGESLHVAVPTETAAPEMQVSWPLSITGSQQPRIVRRAPHVAEHTAEVLTELGFSRRRDRRPARRRRHHGQ